VAVVVLVGAQEVDHLLRGQTTARPGQDVDPVGELDTVPVVDGDKIAFRAESDVGRSPVDMADQRRSRRPIDHGAGFQGDREYPSAIFRVGLYVDLRAWGVSPYPHGRIECLPGPSEGGLWLETPAALD